MRFLKANTNCHREARVISFFFQASTTLSIAKMMLAKPPFNDRTKWFSRPWNSLRFLKSHSTVGKAHQFWTPWVPELVAYCGRHANVLADSRHSRVNGAPVHLAGA